MNFQYNCSSNHKATKREINLLQAKIKQKKEEWASYGKTWCQRKSYYMDYSLIVTLFGSFIFY
jgi:hypothetical protein